MKTNKLRPTARLQRGPLYDLLLRLYAYGPGTIEGPQHLLRDFRLACIALKRGWVELSDPEQHSAMKTNKLCPTPHLKGGPLYNLLLRLYAYGVVLSDPEPLHRDPSWNYLRMIQLTPVGRARLGLPPPAALGDRLPLAVLNEAIAFFLGRRVQLVSDPSGELIAIPKRPCTPALGEAPIIASVRLAAEQGVVCEPIFEDPTGEFVFVGFMTPVTWDEAPL